MNRDELVKNPVLTDFDVKVRRAADGFFVLLADTASVRFTVVTVHTSSFPENMTWNDSDINLGISRCFQDLNVDPKLPYEDNSYDVRLLQTCFIRPAAHQNPLAR